jgi:hypothetical protein
LRGDARLRRTGEQVEPIPRSRCEARHIGPHDSTAAAGFHCCHPDPRPFADRKSIRRDVNGHELRGGSAMTVKNATADVLAAVTVLAHARDACARLDPLNAPMTMRQIQQRAEMIDKVIRARCKLQQLRNRAAALEDALARFKATREARRA